MSSTATDTFNEEERKRYLQVREGYARRLAAQLFQKKDSEIVDASHQAKNNEEARAQLSKDRSRSEAALVADFGSKRIYTIDMEVALAMRRALEESYRRLALLCEARCSVDTLDLLLDGVAAELHMAFTSCTLSVWLLSPGKEYLHLVSWSGRGGESRRRRIIRRHSAIADEKETDSDRLEREILFKCTDCSSPVAVGVGNPRAVGDLASILEEELATQVAPCSAAPYVPVRQTLALPQVCAPLIGKGDTGVVGVLSVAGFCSGNLIGQREKAKQFAESCAAMLQQEEPGALRTRLIRTANPWPAGSILSTRDPAPLRDLAKPSMGTSALFVHGKIVGISRPRGPGGPPLYSVRWEDGIVQESLSFREMRVLMAADRESVGAGIFLEEQVVNHLAHAGTLIGSAIDAVRKRLAAEKLSSLALDSSSGASYAKLLGDGLRSLLACHTDAHCAEVWQLGSDGGLLRIARLESQQGSEVVRRASVLNHVRPGEQKLFEMRMQKYAQPFWLLLKGASVLVCPFDFTCFQVGTTWIGADRCARNHAFALHFLSIQAAGREPVQILDGVEGMNEAAQFVSAMSVACQAGLDILSRREKWRALRQAALKAVRSECKALMDNNAGGGKGPSDFLANIILHVQTALPQCSNLYAALIGHAGEILEYCAASDSSDMKGNRLKRGEKGVSFGAVDSLSTVIIRGAAAGIPARYNDGDHVSQLALSKWWSGTVKRWRGHGCYDVLYDGRKKAEAGVPGARIRPTRSPEHLSVRMFATGEGLDEAIPWPFVCVPLHSKQSCLGILSIDTWSPRDDYVDPLPDGPTLSFLEDVASNVAEALQVERRKSALHSLKSALLSSGATVDGALSVIASLVREAVAFCESVTIWEVCDGLSAAYERVSWTQRSGMSHSESKTKPFELLSACEKKLEVMARDRKRRLDPSPEDGVHPFLREMHGLMARGGRYAVHVTANRVRGDMEHAIAGRVRRVLPPEGDEILPRSDGYFLVHVSRPRISTAGDEDLYLLDEMCKVAEEGILDIAGRGKRKAVRKLALEQVREMCNGALLQEASALVEGVIKSALLALPNADIYFGQLQPFGKQILFSSASSGSCMHGILLSRACTLPNADADLLVPTPTLTWDAVYSGTPVCVAGPLSPLAARLHHFNADAGSLLWPHIIVPLGQRGRPARGVLCADGAGAEEPRGGGDVVKFLQGCSAYLGDALDRMGKASSLKTLHQQLSASKGYAEEDGRNCFVAICEALCTNILLADQVEVWSIQHHPGRPLFNSSLTAGEAVLQATDPAHSEDDCDGTKEKLQLVISQCSGLAQADRFGLSDPYCVVRWCGQIVGQTPTIPNTLHPIWGEEGGGLFTLPIDTSNPHLGLEITVWDEDALPENLHGDEGNEEEEDSEEPDFLGQITISGPELYSWLQSPSVEHHLSLEAGKGLPADLVQGDISLILSPQTDPESALAALRIELDLTSVFLDVQVCAADKLAVGLKGAVYVSVHILREMDEMSDNIVEGQAVGQTATMSNTCQPIWLESFRMELRTSCLEPGSLDAPKVVMKVWLQEEAAAAPALLGSVLLSSSDIRRFISCRDESEEYVKWAELRNPGFPSGKDGCPRLAYSLGCGPRQSPSNVCPVSWDHLRLRVLGAEGLAQADLDGLSDPFCRVRLGTEYVGRTGTQYLTLNPSWDWSLDFKPPSPSEVAAGRGNLVLEVWDEDLGEPSDFLGQVIVPGEDLLRYSFASSLELSQGEACTQCRVLELKVKPPEEMPTADQWLVKGQLTFEIECVGDGPSPMRPISAVEQYKTISLRLVGARGLAQADQFGLSDAVGVILLNDRKLGATEAQYNTLEPKWEAGAFSFPLGLDDAVACDVRLEVWDEDDGVISDFLGQVSLSKPKLLSLLDKGDVEMELECMPDRPRKLNALVQGYLTVCVFTGRDMTCLSDAPGGPAPEVADPDMLGDDMSSDVTLQSLLEESSASRGLQCVFQLEAYEPPLNVSFDKKATAKKRIWQKKNDGHCDESLTIIFNGRAVGNCTVHRPESIANRLSQWSISGASTRFVIPCAEDSQARDASSLEIHLITSPNNTVLDALHVDGDFLPHLMHSHGSVVALPTEKGGKLHLRVWIRRGDEVLAHEWLDRILWAEVINISGSKGPLELSILVSGNEIGRIAGTRGNKGSGPWQWSNRGMIAIPVSMYGGTVPDSVCVLVQSAGGETLGELSIPGAYFLSHEGEQRTLHLSEVLRVTVQFRCILGTDAARILRRAVAAASNCLTNDTICDSIYKTSAVGSQWFNALRMRPIAAVGGEGNVPEGVYGDIVNGSLFAMTSACFHRPEWLAIPFSDVGLQVSGAHIGPYASVQKCAVVRRIPGQHASVSVEDDLYGVCVAAAAEHGLRQSRAKEARWAQRNSALLKVKELMDEYMREGREDEVALCSAAASLLAGALAGAHVYIGLSEQEGKSIRYVAASKGSQMTGNVLRRGEEGGLSFGCLGPACRQWITYPMGGLQQSKRQSRSEDSFAIVIQQFVRRKLLRQTSLPRKFGNTRWPFLCVPLLTGTGTSLGVMGMDGIHLTNLLDTEERDGGALSFARETGKQLGATIHACRTRAATVSLQNAAEEAASLACSSGGDAALSHLVVCAAASVSTCFPFVTGVEVWHIDTSTAQISLVLPQGPSPELTSGANRSALSYSKSSIRVAPSGKAERTRAEQLGIARMIPRILREIETEETLLDGQPATLREALELGISSLLPSLPLGVRGVGVAFTAVIPEIFAGQLLNLAERHQGGNSTAHTLLKGKSRGDIMCVPWKNHLLDVCEVSAILVIRGRLHASDASTAHLLVHELEAGTLRALSSLSIPES